MGPIREIATPWTLMIPRMLLTTGHLYCATVKPEHWQPCPLLGIVHCGRCLAVTGRYMS